MRIVQCDCQNMMEKLANFLLKIYKFSFGYYGLEKQKSPIVAYYYGTL